MRNIALLLGDALPYGDPEITDLHSLVAKLDQRGGFTKDNYLVWPVICSLQGMKYIGRAAWTYNNLAKYHGWSYGIAVRNHRPNRPPGSFHFTHSTRGVKKTSSDGSVWAMMDPMDPPMSELWYNNAHFSPVDLRLMISKPHWIMKHKGYGANAWASAYTNGYYSGTSSVNVSKTVVARPVGALPSGALKQTTAKKQLPLAESANEDQSGDPMLILSSVWIISSKGIFIDRVSGPGFVCEKTALPEEPVEGPLLADISSEDIDDDVEAETAPPVEVPIEADLSPVCSVFSCDFAKVGGYQLELSGPANANYTLTIADDDSFGEQTVREITGKLDQSGKAIATFGRDPGTICAKLSDMKKLEVGAVCASNEPMQVTYASGNEFFLESRDRACGVRVVVSDPSQMPSMIPGFVRLATVAGQMIQKSPEVTIQANKVICSASTETSIAPVAISGKWPAMASCLLSRIWGIVKSVDGSTAVIDNGAEEITISELDIPVSVGDHLTVNAVLRADRHVKAIVGSAQTN